MSGKIAKFLGVLYIIGTAAGILSLITAGSAINAPDYLNLYPILGNQVWKITIRR